MKFWEWLIKKEVPKEEEVQKIPSETSGYPDIIAELDILDRQYILSRVSIDLCQDSANDGYKDYSGVFTVETANSADDILVDWATGPAHLRNGALNFYSCRDSMKEGMVFSIVFTEARCVSLKEKEEKEEKKKEQTFHCTQLCISPRSLLIGNEKTTNTWK